MRKKQRYKEGSGSRRGDFRDRICFQNNPVGDRADEHTARRHGLLPSSFLIKYFLALCFIALYSLFKSILILGVSSEPVIDFSSLNTAVHGPVRLGVLTALKSEGTLDFTTLKHRLKTADGAIGTHLQKLEGIGYITVTKRFVGKRPNSSYSLTSRGRDALFEYLRTMQRLIDAMNLPSIKHTKHPS